MRKNTLAVWSPEGAVHQPDRTPACILNEQGHADIPVHADKLASRNEKAHRLDGIHLHADLRLIRPDPGELPVRRPVGGGDEPVANVHRENEGVVHILPVGPAKDKGLKILPHELMHRLPLSAHRCGRPPMAVELHIFDPANVCAEIDKNSPAQNAPHHAADPVAHIVFRPDPDPVVAVDQRNVLHRVVVALQMERPGIWMNLPRLLLRIPHRKSANGRRVTQFKQGRGALLIAASGGQNHHPQQRLAPDRGTVAPFECDSRRDAEAAGNEVSTRGEQHPATQLARRSERLRDGGGVVHLAVPLGTECADREGASLLLRNGRETEQAECEHSGEMNEFGQRCLHGFNLQLC